MKPARAAAILLSLIAALPGPSARETPARISAPEQVQVNLVLIDVVVRDGKGDPVPGLTRDAFELLVDRLPVEPDAIESFEEICSAPATAAGSGEAAGAQAAPAATPATPAAAEDQGGSTLARHIVIVFDFSHLTLSGRRQSLQAARDYLSRGLAPADRVMILAFKRDLRLVQDFTSSSSLLAARIDEMLPDTASLEGEVLEEGSKVLDVSRVPCDAEQFGRNEGLHAGATCYARRARANHYAVEEEARSRRALKALEDLMPALSSLRGRKALIVFSDVLRDEPGIQFTSLAGATPVSLGLDIKEDILRLTREANAAGVAFYTVHAGGVEDPAQTLFARAPGDARDTQAARDAVGTAARSGLDAALSMQTTLATETGGRAIQRTNDLASVLEVARQDLSCHYLIGYRHAGLGDNQRHSLIVRMSRPGGGRSPRYEVRHRPYYIDYAPSERRERLMRSAMDLPRMHPAVPLSLEAFALAPSSSGRRVLVKATIPLGSLSLLPAGGGQLQGRIRLRGEVSPADGGEPACRPDAEIPVSLPRAADTAAPPERLVFETECDLAEGSYDLVMAVMDVTTQETGGKRVPLVVPRRPAGNEPLVSDVHLWVRDPSAILVTSGAGGIGLKDRPAGSEAGAFVPLARRQLSLGQAAFLSVFVCPAAGARVDQDHPVRARRVLRGEAGATVADFRDLTLVQPPDPGSGCWQLLHQIPAGALGPGIYTFQLHAMGDALGAPLEREADLAVE